MLDFHQFTGPFRIRGLTTDVWPAAREDAGALARLHASAFPLAGESWGPDEFRSLLGQGNVFAYRAVRSGMMGRGVPAPRGFVLAREADGEAEILTIAVHPSWQGRGIGRSLMDAVLRELYARRAEALFLEVNEDNEAALALYRRLGFDEVGRRDNYYSRGDGRTALTMRLRLDGV